MLLTLEELKPYLRMELDYIEEDTNLQLLIDNAEIYIVDSSRSIETMGEKSLKKAKLLAMFLISDWYENRDYTKNLSEKVRYTVKSLLMQLQLRGDD